MRVTRPSATIGEVNGEISEGLQDEQRNLQLRHFRAVA
jgi:hypothetical protein